MLVQCPECERNVSDRAEACPQCGFPVAKHVAAQAEARRRDESRTTRRHVGDVDCVDCKARGFSMMEVKGDDGVVRQMFEWCVVCEHSGRVQLCESSAGFYAVGHAQLEEFLAGRVDEGAPGVHALGTERPAGHRYSEAGNRYRDEDDKK